METDDSEEEVEVLFAAGALGSGQDVSMTDADVSTSMDVDEGATVAAGAAPTGSEVLRTETATQQPSASESSVVPSISNESSTLEGVGTRDPQSSHYYQLFRALHHPRVLYRHSSQSHTVPPSPALGTTAKDRSATRWRRRGRTRG